MEKHLGDLTNNEIDRLTHLYINGFNDFIHIGERFNLNPKEIEKLFKEVGKKENGK